MNFIKIVKFDFMNIVRNHTLLFCNTFLPVALIWVMGFVTRNRFGGQPVSSFDYYGLNMAVLSAALVAMTATNTFMEDRVKNGNLRIIFAPVSKDEIYLAKIFSTYSLSAITYTAVLLLGQYMAGLNFGGNDVICIIILLHVFLLFGTCLGILSVCVFKSEEKANAAIQIPIALFIFFGGIFFGIHRLGPVVQTISMLSPVKWLVECGVRIIYDQDFSLFVPVVGVLFLLSVALVLICHFVFQPEECI